MDWGWLLVFVEHCCWHAVVIPVRTIPPHPLYCDMQLREMLASFGMSVLEFDRLALMPTPARFVKQQAAAGKLAVNRQSAAPAARLSTPVLPCMPARPQQRTSQTPSTGNVSVFYSLLYSHVCVVVAMQ